MMNKLIRITAPHFVAGIETYSESGRYDGYPNELVEIHRCAPIIKYMKSWTMGRIKHYCDRKHWIYEVF